MTEKKTPSPIPRKGRRKKTKAPEGWAEDPRLIEPPGYPKLHARDPRPELTPGEGSMLQAIISYHDKFSMAPTFRELMAILGFQSPNTVSYYVDKLIGKGYVTMIEKSPRSIVVVEIDVDRPKEEKARGGHHKPRSGG
jgi:hypothetical protein